MQNNSCSPVWGYQKRPSLIDFSGHLSAVFFCKGCNFRCGFCHNPELVGLKQDGLSWVVLESVCKSFKKNWVDAVVISGGEPTIHERLPDLCAFLKSQKLKIKLDTNGSNPEMLKLVMNDLDYIAMDIKCSLKRYSELTGYLNLEAIEESLRIIKSSNVPYEFRTTVIESIHTEEEIREMQGLIKGAMKYSLQPFVPKSELLDAEWTKLPRTSKGHIEKLREIISKV